MGYDLVFWRQDESDDRPPDAILEAFSNGLTVQGLPELSLEEFLGALLAAFPDAVRQPNGSREWIDWVSPDELSSFQVEWTNQYVWITCRPLDEKRANQMIDIANSFGCALYDPQTNERFDS